MLRGNRNWNKDWYFAVGSSLPCFLAWVKRFFHKWKTSLSKNGFHFQTLNEIWFVFQILRNQRIYPFFKKKSLSNSCGGFDYHVPLWWTMRRRSAARKLALLRRSENTLVINSMEWIYTHETLQRLLSAYCLHLGECRRVLHGCRVSHIFAAPFMFVSFNCGWNWKILLKISFHCALCFVYKQKYFETKLTAWCNVPTETIICGRI